MKFVKAHGLENDFLLVERSQAPEDPGPWARRLCARHTGAGADGVVLYALEGSGARMHLLNADGSRAEVSGNGLRCLAAYLFRKGLRPAAYTVLTDAGPRPVEIRVTGTARYEVTTDLGVPILASSEIPVALHPPQPTVVDHPLEVLGEPIRITATSLGNPHCAVFRETLVDDPTLCRIGAALEHHAFFPAGTNVEFVTVVSDSVLRLRMWERGVGYTRSSGTGAGSASVAAILTGRVKRHLRVVCDGGEMNVAWDEGKGVQQTGPVEILLEGNWLA